MEFIIRAEELPIRLGLNSTLLKRIHHETGGKPGALATSIIDALNEAEKNTASAWSSSATAIKRTGIVVFVMLLAVGLLFQEQINQFIDPGIKRVKSHKRTVPAEPEMQLLGELDQLVPTPKPVPLESGQQEPEGESSEPPAIEPVAEEKELPVAPPEKIETLSATPVVVAQAETTIDQAASEVEPEPIEAVEAPSEQSESTVDETRPEDTPAKTTTELAPETDHTPDSPLQPSEPTPELASDNRDLAPDGSETEPETETETEPGTKPGTEQNQTAPTIEAEFAENPPQPAAAEEPLQQLEILPTTGLSEPPPNTLKKEVKQEQPSLPFQRDTWLRKQPPHAYAIQMMGVEHLHSLLDFVRRYKLEQRAIYFESRRHNKPWHVLLWGVYPDRKSAYAARAELPPPLQQKDQWIRRLDSIQASMLKAP